MNTEITIADSALRTLREHAAREYPHECCGFLYGSSDGGRIEVTVSRAVMNTSVENRERRFMIDPHMYLAAERFADQHNLELLGVYHSHPDHPAEPSETDLAHALPEFAYLIVSVRDGHPRENRWWLLVEDRSGFEEIEAGVISDISVARRRLKGVALQ